MKYTLICLLTALSLSLYGQEFYDITTIQTIEITFEQSNWDALLDAQKAGDEDYIMARTVAINGEVFDSVGVKYKGNSTYQANQTKNPWHIELDTYKSQNYQGYKDIKLSNVAKDPSFVREVLSYKILRQYMDAPKSNYANVYVNGDLIGLYSNSEAISKTFVDDRFGSNDNTFVKCNPPAGAGPQSRDLPYLTYLGQDSTDYYDAYEVKSDGGWQELIDLCDTLNNEFAVIDQILDIDRALWMLAFNNVLVNLDSYSGKFAQNYYLYRSDYDQFMPIVWDLNESFGQFSDTGNGQLSSTTAKQNMDLFLHENDSDYPLIQKLLSNDRYRKIYLAHIKTMLLENFDNEEYFQTGMELQTLIDEAVNNDPNKLTTYASFQQNLTADVSTGGGGGPGGGRTPGITTLMDGRTSYLLSQPTLSAVEPVIENVEPSSTPEIGSMVTILAQVTNSNTVILGHRNNKRAPFQKVEMFDDGMHGDGEAGDGLYGGSYLLEERKTQYYIYAENDNIGKFSPTRAEYEYYRLDLGIVETEPGDLVINELMASNDNTISDQDGEYDDWIELFNNSAGEIDLSNYHITDGVELDNAWTIPAGTTIPSNGYLIIWADDDTDQEGLHADFKLSAGGETLTLWNADDEVIDQVVFDEQITDISYGRFVNGTGDFMLMGIPTPNAQNNGTTDLQEETVTSLEVYPNPTSDILHIELSSSLPESVSIYDQLGREVHRQEVSGNVQIDVKNWAPGLYIVAVDSKTTKIIIK